MYRFKRDDWYSGGELIDSQGLVDLRQNDIEVLELRDVVPISAGAGEESIRDFRYPSRWELQMAQPTIIPPGCNRVVLHAWIESKASLGGGNDIDFRFCEGSTTAIGINFTSASVNSDADTGGKIVRFTLDIIPANQPRISILQLWMRGQNDSFDSIDKNWFNFDGEDLGEIWPYGQVAVPSDLFEANLDDAERYNLLFRDTSTGDTPSASAVPYNRVSEETRPTSTDDGQPSGSVRTWYIYPTLGGLSNVPPFSARPFTGARIVAATAHFEQGQDYVYTAQTSDLGSGQALDGAVPRALSSFLSNEISGPRVALLEAESLGVIQMTIPHRLYADEVEITIMGRSAGFFSDVAQATVNIFDIDTSLIKTEAVDIDLLSPEIGRERNGYEAGGDGKNLFSREQLDGFFAELRIFSAFTVKGLYDARGTDGEAGVLPLLVRITFQNENGVNVSVANTMAIVQTLKTPIDAADEDGTNALKFDANSGLQRNDPIAPAAWESITSNQNWLYGHLTPTWGVIGNLGDTVAANAGDIALRCVAVGGKARSNSLAPASVYEELVLVTYGSDADWTWRITDSAGTVITESRSISTGGSSEFDVYRFASEPGEEYFVEWVTNVGRPTITAIFVGWPFLSDGLDFPK